MLTLSDIGISEIGVNSAGYSAYVPRIRIKRFQVGLHNNKYRPTSYSELNLNLTSSKLFARRTNKCENTHYIKI